MFRAAPDLDAVFVPIGLGSGICAAAAARAALGRKMKLIGVVSAHAPAYALSIAARRAVEAPVSTVIADGMACRTPDPTALEILFSEVDEVVQVTDLEVAGAIKALYLDTHNVAEGAGAASLAAALKLAIERPESIQGKQIGLTLCGGNVDHDMFAGVLNG
jgi:threonine dehydratase